MSSHKRQYHATKDKCHVNFKHIRRLHNYLEMTENDCLEALTFVLNNKFSCVKKTNKPHTRPCTHNIVSTVHVRTNMPKIDLEVIAQSFRNSSYDRKRFAAITIRIANPKITALLFSSGALQQSWLSLSLRGTVPLALQF